MTESQRRWYERNKAEIRARVKARWAASRAEILAALGPFCKCCGEAEPLFLDVDHINGVSDEEKALASKKRLTSTRLHTYILEHLDEFQVLCSNCNQGKARNGGVCPHQR